MAMKKKLTKAEFDKLSDTMKAEYISDGADGFKLDLTDDEDTGPLRRALEREKQAAGTSKARVAELEAEIEKLTNDDARKRGDIATLEKSWEGKMNTQKTEYEGRIGRYESHMKAQLIDNVALQMATKISKSPTLLIPHIKSRLSANLEGDAPSTVVLGADGKPSALTLAQLEAEFVANKDFSAIILASKASGGAGGGASNGNGGGAGGFGNNQGNNAQAPDLSKMNPKQLSEHLAAKKAEQNS